MKGFETVNKRLGFGAMRLPMFASDKPDMEQIQKMVDYFMEKGFTYFDSAFTYLDGQSETILGKTLVSKYPRDSFCIATKTPMFSPVPQSELYRRVEVQLGRYGTDHFDYYLLHNIAGQRLQYFTENGGWEFINDIKAKGITKHIGFSFHDKADVLDKILTDHPEVDFVQLQINYIDWFSDNVQSMLNYEVAKKHGKPVVVMEPIKGGALAGLPQAVIDRFKETNPNMSLAEWALRFVLSLDNVAVVLSGMSTMEQVVENVDKLSDDHGLNEEEMKAIDDVRKIMETIPTVPCTACNYCTEVCPVGIRIPQMISAYNSSLLYGPLGGRSTYMMNAVRDGVKPAECLKCQACEGNCPQNIEITKYLDEIVGMYGDL